MPKIEIIYIESKISKEKILKYCFNISRYIFKRLKKGINLSLTLLKLIFIAAPRFFLKYLVYVIKYIIKILSILIRLTYKYFLRYCNYFFKKILLLRFVISSSSNLFFTSIKCNIFSYFEMIENVKSRFQKKIKLHLYKNKAQIFLSITRSSDHKNKVCLNYVKNVQLIGGSSIYINNGEVFHPESIDVNLDRFAEEYRGFFNYNNVDNKIEIRSNSMLTLRSRALTINLMGGVANNYAHWISEILPRLFYLLDNINLKKINILVNENTHNNLISTIYRLVNNLSSVKIFIVENGASLKVYNLCNVLNIGYCQFEPRNRAFPRTFI